MYINYSSIAKNCVDFRLNMKKVLGFLICLIFSLSLNAQNKIGIEFNNTMIINKETRTIVSQWKHHPIHIIIDVTNSMVYIEDIQQSQQFYKFDILKTGNPEKNVWGYMLHDRYIVLDIPNKELQIYIDESEDVTVCQNIDITFFS